MTNLGKTYIKPIATGAEKPYDPTHPDRDNKRNCTVRALSNCTGMTYDEAHVILKQNGRKDGHGTDFNVIFNAYKDYVKDYFTVGNTNPSKYYTGAVRKLTGKYPECKKGCTLGNFIKNNPTGTYAVMIDSHILCVKQGNIIDNFDLNKNKRVMFVFEF